MGSHPDPDASLSDPAGIERALRAGARGLWLVTPDERRWLSELERIGAALQWPVHTWSAAAGVDFSGEPTPFQTVLRDLSRRSDPAIMVALGAGSAARNPAGARALREACQRSAGPAIVVLDPQEPDAVEADLERSIPELRTIRLPAPTADQLRARLVEVGEVLEDSGYPGAAQTLERGSEVIVRAGSGLSEHAFELTLAEAILDHELDVDALARFMGRAKTRRLPLLEPIEPAPAEELGGLSSLKQWLTRRALALQPGARQAAIPLPRGVLLIGVQGCGKSLAARTCPSMLGLPLLRLDPGRLFGGTVGESEANLRTVMAAAERIAPVVVWIDELDKGLAGLEGGRADGGTSARVLGGLLTWLAEREQAVFVVATANRVDGLPPELLRRGRLDELFFVDLPGADERRDIIRILIVDKPARQGLRPSLDSPIEAFEEVAAAAHGFSGAELEAALTEARLESYAAGRPLTARDLETAIKATVPLSVTRAEDVDALREWAVGRARPAR